MAHDRHGAAPCASVGVTTGVRRVTLPERGEARDVRDGVRADFGDRLHLLISQSGHSVQEVADALGYSREALYPIFAGQRPLWAADVLTLVVRLPAFGRALLAYIAEHGGLLVAERSDAGDTILDDFRSHHRLSRAVHAVVDHDGEALADDGQIDALEAAEGLALFARAREELAAREARYREALARRGDGVRIAHEGTGAAAGTAGERGAWTTGSSS